MIRKLLFAISVLFAVKSDAQMNLDFEALSPGTFNSIAGWTLTQSSYTGNTAYCSVYTPTMPTSVNIVTTPVNIGPGTPSVVPNSPFGGNNVLEFSYVNLPGTGFQRIAQTITVTATNKFFRYAYFANVTGGDHGNCCQTHYFKFWMTDCSSNIIPCSSVAVLPTTTLCPNTGTLGMQTTTLVQVYTPNWIIKNVDLSAYIGSCVTFYGEDAMCAPGGHFPLLFLDATVSANLIQPAGGNQTGNNYLVCSGNPATLTALPANSYTWSGPGGFVSNNQTVITNTAGIYTLSVGNYGCGGPTQTINVQFGNTPTVNAVANTPTICPGASAILTATGNGINTYSWSNGAISQSVSVSPSVSTVYTVTVNSGTCPATATVAVNVTTCTSIYKNIQEQNVFRIFPNPNKGNFAIKSDKEENIFIYDQLGRIMKEIKLNAANNFSADLSGFSPGIYFISNKLNTKRIIVMD